jgi:hypothetical protein
VKVVSVKNDYVQISEFKVTGYGLGGATWLIKRGSFGSVTSKSTFNDKYDAALRGERPFVIYRECTDCIDSHKHIFYRRITPDEAFDAYEAFMVSWTQTNNSLGVHFNLYSTLWQAQNNNSRWSYCNYATSQNIGFPNKCGPS